MTKRLAITIAPDNDNAGPHTIWGKLAVKLGREPTHKEASDEVRRILNASKVAP